MNQPPAAIRGRSHWATPIFSLANPDHAAIKPGLVEHCYELERRGSEASTVAPAAKRNMFESKFNFFMHDRPEVQRLQGFCLSAVHQVGATVNGPLWEPDVQVQVIAVESWCHITRSGGYHDVHAHPMCSWCGIYYVDPGDADAAERNGVNRFYDPRGNVNAYSDYATRYLNSDGSIDMAAREGNVVLFPSYLRHAALPYTGARDRIVVAFNTRTHRIE